MKKLIKRYSPNPETIHQHKHLGWLSKHFNHNLWYFNRRSVSRAFAIGLFAAFIPVPFQMVLAAIGSVLFPANIAVAIALVWITNPLTMPVIFYGTYRVGAWLLDTQINTNFTFSPNSFFELFGEIWQPFLLGCLLTSIVSSIFGYLLIQSVFRWQAYAWSKRNKTKRLG